MLVVPLAARYSCANHVPESKTRPPRRADLRHPSPPPVRQRILDHYGETPESLRDLSVSLDNVATINELRGQLDPALDAYLQAITWYERLDATYGPAYAQPDQLADLRASADRVRARLGAGD